MLFQFDSDKDKVNVKKHGISLADAELLDWSTLRSYHDKRFDYGEDRQIGFAFLNKRLHAVVYT